MKNLRLFVFATGPIFVATGVLAACSSDDTVVTTPDADAGDARTDTARPDSGTPDAPTPTEDARVDAPPDVITDAGLKKDTFALQLANAMCNSLARCCFGNANLDGGAAVDGGSYDRDKCVALFDGLGVEGSLVAYDPTDGGAANVELDQAKGAECIQRASQLTCAMTATEMQAARAACYAALRGKLAAGAACTASIDCAPGHFCHAVTNKCEAIRGPGGSCGDLGDDPARADEACSNRGSGEPPRYCDFYNFGTGELRPKNEWTCAPARLNDQSCANTLWCANGLCDETDLLCRSPVDYFPPSLCGSFVKE